MTTSPGRMPNPTKSATSRARSCTNSPRPRHRGSGRPADQLAYKSVKLIVHDLHCRIVDHATERLLVRDLPHPLRPRMEVVIRQLSVFVRVPGDLEERELHQIQEVILNLSR